jgi:hypothetical protein
LRTLLSKVLQVLISFVPIFLFQHVHVVYVINNWQVLLYNKESNKYKKIYKNTFFFNNKTNSIHW